MRHEDYKAFLASRSQYGSLAGFEPVWLPDSLFPFQRELCEWSIRKGRAAILAACGLGKTYQQLVWAENVVRHANRPVLILTPLAVAQQTVREADKFGVDAVRSVDGSFPPGARIVVANYDRLHYFSPDSFAGVVCDESSCLKNMGGKRTAEVTEFLRTVDFRLLCTATPAPNDYDELGTSAQALGEMGYQDMLTRFFKKQTAKDHLGWGRTKYRLKGHADRDFWRWVCSWARAVRKPSDLGFDDAGFILPPLTSREHTVVSRTKRPGYLFDLPAMGLDEEREERRRTIEERCEKVAELVAARDGRSICWCHLNDEGDLLEKMIPGSVQVSGSDSTEWKETAVDWFVGNRCVCPGAAPGRTAGPQCACGHESGKRVLISKPIVFGYGLNLQCCTHMTFFPSHSWEQYHQAVRRCWRFGQTRPVDVDMIASEGENGVLANLQRKSEAAEALFDNLVELMNDHMNVRRGDPFTAAADLPPWLARTPHPAPERQGAPA